MVEGDEFITRVVEEVELVDGQQERLEFGLRARKAVGDLARRAGFEPVDAGPLRNARLLESMAVLWIHLATKGGLGRRWTFTLGPRP